MNALVAIGGLRHRRCDISGETERKPERKESQDDEETVTSRGRPHEGRDKPIEAPNLHRPDPGQSRQKRKKENTMFATPVTKTSRPVAVLLGGSGYARPATRTPAVPAETAPAGS